MGKYFLCQQLLPFKWGEWGNGLPQTLSRIDELCYDVLPRNTKELRPNSKKATWYPTDEQHIKQIGTTNFGYWVTKPVRSEKPPGIIEPEP